MNKSFVFGFGIFVVVFFSLFLLGLVGTIISIKQYSEIKKISKSTTEEMAIITKIENGVRTLYGIFYFRTKASKKEYKIHLIKILASKIRVGDEIHIKFNENRDIWLISEYLFSTYVSHFFKIIVFAFCFVLSIFLFICIINIYKNR
jgi:hypothetical protein